MRKSEGIRSHGRQWRWWDDDIKIDLKEIGWEGVHWINLAQERNKWLGLKQRVEFLDYLRK